MSKHKHHHNKKISNKVDKNVLVSPKVKQKNNNKSQKTEGSIPFFKKIKNWFFALLAILGFCFSIYHFYPRISIQETQLLNPYDPFYYPFVIKNIGNIKVTNFKYALKTINVILMNGNSFGHNFLPQKDSISKIKVNGFHPINLIHLIQADEGTISEAQIFIKYSYSIPIFKFNFIDSTKFVLHRDFQKKYKWIEYQY